MVSPDSVSLDLRGRQFSRIAAIGGLLAAGAGIVALLGWSLGLPRLASLSAGLIPMAPSTALAFMLLGGAVFVRARMPLDRRAHVAGIVLGSTVALGALALFVLSSRGIFLDAERFGLAFGEAGFGVPVGHMSPLTAAGFLLASVSFLILLRAAPGQLGLAMAAAGLSGLLLTACFVFLLAYLYGTPLLYGGPVIPPALPTVLAQALLGAALLALAGPILGSRSGPRLSEVRTSGLLSLIFIVLALGIVTAGFLYFRSVEAQSLSQTEHQLASIADLKIRELALWRKERLADAEFYLQNAAFSALVRRHLDQPEAGEVRETLRAWLGGLQTSYGYDRVMLLDTRFAKLLMVQDAPDRSVPPVSEGTAAILRSGKVAFEDFYWSEDGQRIYLKLLVPIRDVQDKGRTLAILELRIDPATYLYHAISGRFTPGDTAEILLVRRDGNDALFLNNLKSQKEAALKLRIPLSSTDTAAVKAVLGQEGVVQAVDYRRAPVLAALRAVPDSPWFLVARIDLAEVYSPIRERLWSVILIVGVLLLAAGVSTGVVWRQQRLRFYRDRAEAAEALRTSQQQLRAIVEGTPDAVYLKDLEGRYVMVNQATCRFVGKSADKVIGQDDISMFPSAEASAVMDLDRKVMADGRIATYEEHVTTADGVSRTFLSTKGPLSDANGETIGLFGIARDITERKRAEEALQKSEARIQFVLNANHTGTWDLDLVGHTTVRTLGHDQIFGYDELLPQWTYEMFLGHVLAEDRAEVDQKFQKAIREQSNWNIECRIVRRDGEQRWIWVCGQHRVDAEGRSYSMAGIVQDITERKQMEDQVRQMAFHDVLTKLPNRRLLNDRLSQAMAASKRSGCYGAMMFLDLDNFKSLNDTHGHEVGDLLLIKAADRLKSCVREMDTVARFGGDEFVVMISELDADKSESTTRTGIIAEKIRAAMAKPYVLQVRREGAAETTVEHQCTASIGVALFGKHEASQEDILKWADTAMYQAKETGHNLIRFHDSNA